MCGELKEKGKCAGCFDSIVDDQVIYFMRSYDEKRRGIHVLVDGKDGELITHEIDLGDCYLESFRDKIDRSRSFIQLKGMFPDGCKFIRLKDFAETTDCPKTLKLLLPLVFILDTERLCKYEIQDLLAVQAKISMLCCPKVCCEARIRIFENIPAGAEITS